MSWAQPNACARRTAGPSNNSRTKGRKHPHVSSLCGTTLCRFLDTLPRVPHRQYFAVTDLLPAWSWNRFCCGVCGYRSEFTRDDCGKCFGQLVIDLCRVGVLLTN